MNFIASPPTSAGQGLVAKLIDRNCQGGEAATIINYLSADQWK